MSKQLKKEPYKVKFDITAGNLDCFMRLSSRHRESESAESHSRKRKKSKMSRDRKQEFEDNAFLENILTKVLNEEFRNPGELKQLIDTMQFPAAE